MMYNYLYIPHY